MLQNDDYGSDFAFNDLISSLTRGKANGMLFIGHTPEYLASDYKRSLEVFANITCIDMSESAIRPAENFHFPKNEEINNLLYEHFHVLMQISYHNHLHFLHMDYIR